MNLDYIITDYITGKSVRNVGPEASRQVFEKFLVPGVKSYRIL